MTCLICQSPTEYYFSKAYTEPPFDQLMKDIGPVVYHRCPRCGFVVSKTHCDLEFERWSALNSGFHHLLETVAVSGINQPPYAEQALALHMLASSGVLDLSRCIDYAAGYGTLSRLLAKYFDDHLPIFDPYVTDGDPSRYVAQADLGVYKTVINSAMFEHIVRRDDLDAVNRLVAQDGCLVVHTLVAETVPCDPSWFYLRPPVHTAFHTNSSMSLLMQQWGYRCSLYSPKAKIWVMFKQHSACRPQTLASLNTELQSDWFHYKDGFVDYWK